MFLGSRRWVAMLMGLCLLTVRNAAAAPTVQISDRHYLPALDNEVPGYGGDPAAAAFDDGYLVVYLTASNPYPDAVVARLVDANGVPKASPFDIHPAANSTTNIGTPAVAFDGTSFVVVWLEVDLATADQQSTVLFARVSTSGELLTSPTVLDTKHNSRQVAVSAGETGTLVVDCDYPSCKSWLIDHDGNTNAGDTFPSPGNQVGLAFSDGAWLAFSSSGHVEQYAGDATRIEGTSADLALFPAQYFASVAPASDGFVLASDDGRVTRFAHVGFDGSAVAEGELLPPADHTDSSPILQAIKDGFLLSHWEYDDPCVSGDCGGTEQLQLLDASLRPQGKPYTQSDPWALTAVSRDGAGALLLSFSQGYATFNARVLTFGASIAAGDSSVVPGRTGSMSTPFAAPGPDGWLLVWSETAFADSTQVRVRGALVDKNGSTAGTPFVITQGSAWAVEVARGPDGWLVETLDRSYNLSETTLFHVSDAGESITFGTFLWGTNTSLAGSPDGWLLVGSSASNVDGRRFGTNGLDASISLGSADSQDFVGVTYGAGKYFATWRNTNGDFDAEAVPTTGSAAGLTPEVLLPSATAIYSRRSAILTNSGWFAIADTGNGYHAWWQGSDTKQALSDFQPSLPLVAVGRLVLIGSSAPGGGPIQLDLAEPGGDLVSKGELGFAQADMSEALGNSVLVTAAVTGRRNGSRRDRVAWQVVQVTDDSVVVGVGGEGGDGGRAGAGAGGGSGNASNTGGNGNGGGNGVVPGEGGGIGSPGRGGGVPGGVGGEMAGGSNTQSGGAEEDATGGDNAGNVSSSGSNEGPSTPPRTSSKASSTCGCRVPGQRSDSRGQSMLFLLPLLLWIRRRDRAEASKLRPLPDMIA